MAADEVKFYFDHHVPKAIAEGLRRRSVDVLTTYEAGLATASDLEQLEFAQREGRVIVTFDSDFLSLDAKGVTHAGIAYAKQGTRSIGEVIRTLLLIHGVLAPEEMENHVEFL